MNYKNLIGLASLITLPVLGCSQAGGLTGALCCTEYTPGTDMGKATFGITDVKVQGEFRASAQAAGDIVSVADTLLTDVGNACRNIALDLGASPEEAAKNDKLAPRDAVATWCTLAGKLVGEAVSMFSIQVKADAEVKCEASISANVDCKAGCDVDAKCEVNATPPVCKGGELVVDCNAKCNVTAELPKISCEGKCELDCEGSCSATATVPTVACEGTCSGTCEGAGGAGTSGVDASGTCKGKCNGTCTAKPGSAAVKCEGKCQGKCNAACTSTGGGASVKCSGKCEVEAKPLECKGGKLEGGCKVNAKCEANCNASAQAKASCEPPKVQIAATVNPKAQAVIDSLQKNLPLLIVAIKARGAAFGTLIGDLTGTIKIDGDIGVSGTACLVKMGETLGEATQNTTVSLKGAADVTGAVGMK
jgi:hypothetical protein